MINCPFFLSFCVCSTFPLIFDDVFSFLSTCSVKMSTLFYFYFYFFFMVLLYILNILNI